MPPTPILFVCLFFMLLLFLYDTFVAKPLKLMIWSPLKWNPFKLLNLGFLIIFHFFNPYTRKDDFILWKKHLTYIHNLSHHNSSFAVIFLKITKYNVHRIVFLSQECVKNEIVFKDEKGVGVYKKLWEESIPSHQCFFIHFNSINQHIGGISLNIEFALGVTKVTDL